MQKFAIVAAVTAAVMSGFGYQVSLGTYVSNAGKQVAVPVMLDSSEGLSTSPSAPTPSSR